MAITDTSASLSLTWTEQSAVTFTAGTLATIANCVTEVESKLRRGTLSTSTVPSSTEVQRWLTRAKQELAALKNFSWKRRYAYADTTAGTYRYALPPDYDGGFVSIADTTNDREINLWPEHVFNTKYPDPSAESRDEPLIGTIKNRELWLIPPPAGTYRLEIQYSRSGDDNTATDFSYLPELDRFRCCDFAVMQAFKSLHMWEQSGLYRQDWMDNIALARRQDGKRKWARMQYQAISWLNQAAVRNYQKDSE